MRTTHRFIAAASIMFLAIAAQAKTARIFYDDFSNVKNTSLAATTYLTGSTDGESDFDGDNSGWHGKSVAVGPSAVRFGNASHQGWALTPEIRLSGDIQSESVAISFSAAAHNNNSGNKMSLSLVDGNGAEIDGTSKTFTLSKLPSSGDTDVDSRTSDASGSALAATFDNVPAVFRVRFAAAQTDGRVFLGRVEVGQLVPPLASPITVVATDRRANGFDVEWGAVEGATGYYVVLFDANGSVVSANDVLPGTTSASFDGLTSSSDYTVSVAALGDGETTDDSPAATLAVTTAASATAAPTLAVAVTSWTAGLADTSAVSATLEGGAECEFESVSMSDGSAASVENGTLSWTPPASTEASTVTATFHVVSGTDGWDVAQVLSVAATPAPAAPSIGFSNVSARSFDAEWTPGSGGPVSEWKVRAWSGRETPDDATGSASEDFSGYMQDDTVPAGWVFKNTGVHYNQEATPVDFRSDNEWIATPDYGGKITSFSFRLRRQSESGSTFTVYGSSGSADPEVWKKEANKLAEFSPLATQTYEVSVDASKGVSRLIFQYAKNSGNVSIGSFGVSGADWPAADFLEGWGGAKVSVGTGVSTTILNPAAGQANYVEVTAVGPTGLTASSVRPVQIPRAAPPTRITVF